MALEQEETTLQECAKKETTMCRNLKFLLEVVDKLMDPLQGYSLGQIEDTFKDLKVSKIDCKTRCFPGSYKGT